MYIPSYNKFTDNKEVIQFMQRYSFAVIVTNIDGVPEATHLPFIVEQRADKLILVSHFAKANPQTAAVFKEKSLVIFTEPHAYVSPSHYEKELNVPTWNYLAVHAYGSAKLIDDKTEVAKLLEKTISFYEADYMKQWATLPDDFRLKMMNGIVAFEMEVIDLQAKKKLSQNRSNIEQENIIKSFSTSADQNEQDIADYMVASGNK